jgi:hypothetical protein
MKITFELPSSLAQRLRFHVPRGQRSKFVADLISLKLQKKSNALERAAQKANMLERVNRDMKNWDTLDGR